MKFAKSVSGLVACFLIAACGPTEAELAPTDHRVPAETQAAVPTTTETVTLQATVAVGTTPEEGGDELLVFSSVRSGLSQIYVVQLDGTRQTQVTNSEIDTFFPEFSPDGSILLLWVADYSASPPAYGLRFWLGPNNISQVFPFLAGTWSPDGQFILVTFIDEGAQNTDLGLVDMNKGGFTILTTDLADDENADWCGESIVFNRVVGGVPRLFLMDSSGANQRPLELDAELAGRNGAWSSDCGQIAFVSGDESETQIFVVDADGSNLRQLTNSAGHNEDPAWSPDGSQIAFWSDRAGDADIYLMGADGSSQVNITNSPGADESPAWVP